MGDETPKSEREWILRKEEAKLLRYRKEVLVELPILAVLTGLFLAGDRLGLFPPDSASRYGAAVVLALAGTDTLGSIMNWLMYRRLVAKHKKELEEEKST